MMVLDKGVGEREREREIKEEKKQVTSDPFSHRFGF